MTDLYTPPGPAQPRPTVPGLWCRRDSVPPTTYWAEAIGFKIDGSVLFADGRILDAGAEGEWYGPYDPSVLWNAQGVAAIEGRPKLPEGHAELLREAAVALDNEATAYWRQSRYEKQWPLQALASRCRAAAGGTTNAAE